MYVYKAILPINSVIPKDEISEIIKKCAVTNGYTIETNKTTEEQYCLKYNPLNIDMKKLHRLSGLPYLMFEFRMDDKELRLFICYRVSFPKIDYSKVDYFSKKLLLLSRC